MLTNDIDELNKLSIPMDIVVKGQDELGLDYMKYRNYSKQQINFCFSVWAGRKVVVCN